MLKVMTIVGTRPEIIRLSRVIAALDEHLDHVLVHTGQSYDYELSQIFFDELGIRKPDLFLDAAGASAAETIGRVIMATDEAILKYRPDAILLLGDTNSCLAAIAAKRRKVPIFHMEAGNRCFDFRVPEEINRRIVDHIADVNLTYSQIARQYLLREGLPPDQVIATGSPMREVLSFYQDKIAASQILQTLDLRAKGYFLVSAHREENVDNDVAFHRLTDLLDHLANKHGQPVIVSTHPRTRARIEKLQRTFNPLVQFHKPFGFLDYVKLQTEARVVLSDSGTITEESSILDFSAINLREVQERPEGFEEGAVMLTGLDIDRIEEALSIIAGTRQQDSRNTRLVSDYSPTDVSLKILKIIVSYTGFVNRRVWGRQ